MRILFPVVGLFLFASCGERPQQHEVVSQDVSEYVAQVFLPDSLQGGDHLYDVSATELAKVANACYEAGVYAELWEVLDMVRWRGEMTGYGQAVEEFRWEVELPSNAPEGRSKVKVGPSFYVHPGEGPGARGD